MKIVILISDSFNKNKYKNGISKEIFKLLYIINSFMQ